VTHKLLDAREMAHPEPLEQAVSILRQLDNTSCLYMISRKNPIPLLRIAQENHLQSLSHEVSAGEWHVLITPCMDINLYGELNV
jgi:hypothetical protein